MSTFTLDWLRLKCTEILHYWANQLKGTPIFENDHRKINKIKESGDFQPEELLSNINNDTMFGAISNSSVRFDENDSTFLIPQESVDHAVLEADRHEPAFYDVLSFKHPNYDISSSAADKKYMEKVYNVATSGFKEFPVTRKVLKIYEMRQRSEGPDSVDSEYLAPFKQLETKMVSKTLL